MGPYGEDGQPLPAGEDDGLPFTDYELQIESVLKGDGTVTDGGVLVLRMFGHLSNPNAIITPNVFTLPNPGDHLLFALGRNPDVTYGSGPEGLINVDGESVTYADGLPFATQVSPEQFVQNVRDAAADSAVPSTAQDVTFNELFSNPDRCNSRNIVLTGFYFDGSETTVLSETLELTGRAEGHLWPRGQMVWIADNLIPGEDYDQLHQQDMLGPTERYGKLRIEGRFEHGDRYGHAGGFSAQIGPSDVELLPWPPPSNQQ